MEGKGAIPSRRQLAASVVAGVAVALVAATIASGGGGDPGSDPESFIGWGNNQSQGTERKLTTFVVCA